jgi:hypothetical protein
LSIATNLERAVGLLLALGALNTPFARGDGRQVYEVKCLYCHSGELVEHQRLRPLQWRKLVERMRSSAPLLISRSDVNVVVRYLVRDLRLVPKEDLAEARRFAAHPGGAAKPAEPTTVAALEPKTSSQQALPRLRFRHQSPRLGSERLQKARASAMNPFRSRQRRPWRIWKPSGPDRRWSRKSAPDAIPPIASSRRSILSGRPNRLSSGCAKRQGPASRPMTRNCSADSWRYGCRLE